MINLNLSKYDIVAVNIKGVTMYAVLEGALVCSVHATFQEATSATVDG